MLDLDGHVHACALRLHTPAGAAELYDHLGPAMLHAAGGWGSGLVSGWNAGDWVHAVAGGPGPATTGAAAVPARIPGQRPRPQSADTPLRGPVIGQVLCAHRPRQLTVACDRGPGPAVFATWVLRPAGPAGPAPAGPARPRVAAVGTTVTLHLQATGQRGGTADLTEPWLRVLAALGAAVGGQVAAPAAR